MSDVNTFLTEPIARIIFRRINTDHKVNTIVDVLKKLDNEIKNFENYKYFEPEMKKAFQNSGGFVLELNSTRDNGRSVLQNLKDKNIFDESLAVLTLDFAVYNGNFHLITYTALTFTQQFSGYIKSELYTQVIRLGIFERGEEFSLIVFIIFFILIIINLIGESKDWINQWKLLTR